MTKTKLKPQTPVRSTRFLGALRKWEKASVAYMRECNITPTKPAGKRVWLSLQNRMAFNSLTRELRRIVPNAAGERLPAKNA